jgi:hypothetical protein
MRSRRSSGGIKLFFNFGAQHGTRCNRMTVAIVTVAATLPRRRGSGWPFDRAAMPARLRKQADLSGAAALGHPKPMLLLSATDARLWRQLCHALWPVPADAARSRRDGVLLSDPGRSGSGYDPLVRNAAPRFSSLRAQRSNPPRGLRTSLGCFAALATTTGCILRSSPMAGSFVTGGSRASIRSYFMVGIENSAPALTSDGQRAVTVLVLV